MMRVLALILSLLFGGPLAAQDRPEISAVITDQLSAFEAREIDRAFSFASPIIQRLFGTPDNFGQMVATGYPMVWDHGETRFLESRALGNGEIVLQKVLLRDLKGGLHILEYQMVELPQGWKINGVRLLSPPEVGA